MSYPIEIRLASKSGWHTPAEARSYYGRYARDGITVHWWGGGESASKHDNIVNYFLSQAEQGAKSVNYVCSDNKITLLVNPDNVAWASQSGNPTTVSIEFQPTLSAEGYKKGGWLINELEGRYNKGLRLYPHNHWVSTQCPGSIELNRLRAEADKWKRGEYNPKPVPAPTPAPTPPPPAKKADLEWTEWKEGKRMYIFNKDTSLWNFDSTSWNMTAIKPFKKGELFEVFGQVKNKTLGGVYYLTEYSFKKGITNGVNAADLDIYVPPTPPVPAPTPPPQEQPQPQPPNPPAPVPPTVDDRLTALEKVVKRILDFLKSIFNREV